MEVFDSRGSVLGWLVFAGLANFRVASFLTFYMQCLLLSCGN